MTRNGPPWTSAPAKRGERTIEDEVKLGTPEAALRACVGLLAQLFNLNENRLAYYLDLYYQVRTTYEKEMRDETSDLFQFGRFQEIFEPKQHYAGDEETGTRNPPPTAPDCAESAVDLRGMFADIPGGLSDELIGPLPPGGVVYEKPKASKVISEVVKETPKVGKTAEATGSPATPDGFVAMYRQPGPAARAAAEKREILARLEAARAAGVTVKQITEESDGAITEEKIRGILAGERYGIGVYRELDAALKRLSDMKQCKEVMTLAKEETREREDFGKGPGGPRAEEKGGGVYAGELRGGAGDLAQPGGDV